MRKSISIVLIVLIAALSAKDLLMWASFKLNQDFIANVLCENRFNAEVMCNGKCYFTKKIKEGNEENNTKTPFHKATEQREVADIQDIFFLNLKPNVEAYILAYFAEPTFTSQSILDDIFQPPQDCC
ncbi:MAG: hypothetical protein GC192_23880 [Bacteroidetes bacterium]|nr:hypothetical protein [Bacteroidota bacterium]